MTPFKLFLYIIATAGGLGCGAIFAGVLYVAWLNTLGWLKGDSEPVASQPAQEGGDA